jgi:hypothetical protein
MYRAETSVVSNMKQNTSALKIQYTICSLAAYQNDLTYSVSFMLTMKFLDVHHINNHKYVLQVPYKLLCAGRKNR